MLANDLISGCTARYIFFLSSDRRRIVSSASESSARFKDDSALGHRSKFKEAPRGRCARDCTFLLMSFLQILISLLSLQNTDDCQKNIITRVIQTSRRNAPNSAVCICSFEIRRRSENDSLCCFFFFYYYSYITR